MVLPDHEHILYRLCWEFESFLFFPFYDLYFVSVLFFICNSTFYNSSYEIDYTFLWIKFKRKYTSSNYFSNLFFFFNFLYKKEGIYCFKNHISPWRSREASWLNQKWKCLWYKSMKGMWSFQSTKVHRNQAVIQEIFGLQTFFILSLLLPASSFNRLLDD